MAPPSNARVVPCTDVAVRSLGDGAVLVNMRSGACFELNRVGYEIWELLANGMGAEDISQALARRYEIAGEALAADVQRLFEELIRQELIQPGPSL